MSDHDRIVILLTRRIAGELSPAEAEELRLALEQDPTLRELSAAIESVFGCSSKEHYGKRGTADAGKRPAAVAAANGRCSVMGLATEEEKVYQLATRSPRPANDSLVGGGSHNNIGGAGRAIYIYIKESSIPSLLSSPGGEGVTKYGNTQLYRAAGWVQTVVECRQ